MSQATKTFEDAVHAVGNASSSPREMLKSAEQTPGVVYIASVAGAIALSAILFVAGKKDLGIFVGLWPPTVLALVKLLKDEKPSNEL